MTSCRVCTGPAKPGKSWNSIIWTVMELLSRSWELMEFDVGK